MCNRDMFHCFESYKKALVFGTGGGNDIVSALIPALHLRNYGIDVDIAGILSPVALHTYDGEVERTINRIEGNIKRYISGKDRTEITFLDSELPRFIEEEGISISNFYNFSLQFGTEQLKDDLNEFIKEQGYDLVIAVDVGGDILARGIEDPFILSPVMDFVSLYLLDKIDVDCFLIEFGLGTDGELRLDGMDEILDELRLKGLLLDEMTLNSDDDEIVKFRNVFDKVKQIRSGHTAVMTLETLDSSETINTKYRFKSQIGDRKWFTEFDIVLPSKYFGKMWLIDGKGLVKERTITAVPFGNLLERYMSLKMNFPWKTEMDMYYLWSKGWTVEPRGECVHLLIPSKNILNSTRKEMMIEGIEHLKSGKSDWCLMLREDLKHIDTRGLVINGLPDGLDKLENWRKNFTIIGCVVD